ncbi:putative acyl-CoA dehydrogenase AidB [Halomonas elongata]|uniref:Putative acyl-CoA dehydrogenase AidB n=1 Tax=Halomonas elongata TaxID=2746 RepID=A0A1B8P6Z1_HALEL|nr:putative acyl-CoA dehydrogenase AidB [Halomonas elongata]
MREALAREAPDWVAERLAPLGRDVGSEHVRALGEAANRHPPELRLFDRYGRRLDAVDYHPAYHELMHLAMDHGWHAVAWQEEGRGGHQAHVAALYLLTQAEPGFCCPVTMTHAAMPALRHSPSLHERWSPGLLHWDYDPRALPAERKTALTFGMAMTEKQGGSDVRANTTQATPVADGWRLNGHKWFCSAPMSDAFLTLAQTDDGLGCFLVPRFTRMASATPSSCNDSRTSAATGPMPRRKSNTAMPGPNRWANPGAASPPSFRWSSRPTGCRHRAGGDDAPGTERGLAARSSPTRLRPMPGRTALDAYPARRHGPGSRGRRRPDPAHRPCLRRRRPGDAHETALARLLPALAKYWHNKRAPGFLAEAMECLGGIGYVEESPLARLYREAPVNSIWEGSGNVICLDVLRVFGRHPEALTALRQELDAARGASSALDTAMQELVTRLEAPPDTLERQARWLTQRLAQCLQGALLLRHAPAEIGETFCRSRFIDASPVFGTLPADAPEAAILNRIQP